MPGQTEYLNGDLDDLRLFNRAISAAEVTQLYNFYDATGAITSPAAAISNATTSLCAGQTLTASPTSGVTYQWVQNGANIPGATSATYAPTITGNYQVRCTKNNGVGCDSLSPIKNIIVNPLPTANAGVDQTICSGNSATLTATAGTGYTYIWSNSTTTQSTTVSPLSTGSYSLLVTGQGGCTNSDLVIVNVNQSPTANAGVDQSLCTGNSATLAAASGGTGSFSYKWSNGATAQNTTVSPAATTTYTLTVTNTANNCPKIDQITVTVSQTPTASAGSNQTICVSEAVTLIGSGGGNYAWSNGATTSTITVSPASQTTYSLTVTAGAGCSATATATVFVNQPPTATISPASAQSLCEGASVAFSVNAGAGLFYQWKKDGLDIAGAMGPTFSATESGVYSVVVKNASGCSKTSSTVAVTVNSLPAPTILPTGPTDFCEGESVVLNLNAGGGTSFQWKKDGQFVGSGQSITATQSGSYVVEATGAGNCKGTSQPVVVQVFQKPTANAGADTSICKGQPATLAATGGLTYVWSGGVQQNVPFSVQNTATFSVTATDSNGCTDTDDIKIAANPLPTANAGADDEICLFDQKTLTATGGTGYLWSNGATTASIAVSPAASLLYVVTVSNAFQCSDTDSVFVKVNVLPVVAALADAANYCEGETATLTASGAANFQWKKPSGATTSGAMLVLPNLQLPTDAGFYVVIGTDANGCKNADSVQILLKPQPDIVIAGVTKICKNELDQAGGIQWTASGGQVFLWSGGFAGPTLTLVSGGQYSVTATGANGCTAVKTQNLAVDPSPNVAVKTEMPLPIANTICLGSTVILKAEPLAVQYKWFNDSTEQTVSVAPDVTTFYRVTVTNQYGCTDSDSLKIKVNQPPVLAALPDVTICADTLTFFGPSLADAVNFMESDDAGVDFKKVGAAAFFLENLRSGDNFLTFSAAVPPCPDTVSRSFFAHFADQKPRLKKDSTHVLPFKKVEKWSLEANDSLPVIDGGEWLFDLFDENKTAGAWSLGSGGKLDFEPAAAFRGFAEAKYRASNGLCPIFSETDSIKILVSGPIKNGDGEIAITPNGDGMNDELDFDYLDKYPDNEIIIFNRWGSPIWSAKPYLNNWKGDNRNGNPLPEGTYYYYLYLRSSDPYDVQRGSILLMRSRR